MKISYNDSGDLHIADTSLFKGIDYINGGDYKKALQHLEKSSKHNNECAQLLCASIYYMGFGSTRNPKRAIYLFKKTAITWGNRIAQYYVGMMYKDGDGVTQSKESAIKWLTLSANHGCIDAQINLGYLYQTGGEIQVKTDFNKALYYYKKALKMTSQPSEEFYLFNNKEYKMDYDSKELYLYQLSERINKIKGCSSPLTIAKLYSNQQFPTKQKFYEINFWYSVSKDRQNHHLVSVRSLIGELYFYGDHHFEKNPIKAKLWFEKAAKNGNANSQFLMGSLYQSQDDYKQALIWYTMASKNGNRDALFKIAEHYYHIEKDDIKAIYYCELILERAEHGKAYQMLADIYSNNNDIQLNHSKAIQFYLKATELGCSDNSERVKELYQSDCSVKKTTKKLGILQKIKLKST